jgi:MOSC domain-containing protein YiiM
MRPVPRATLRLLGFDGHGQGELVNQGWEEKAVWIYTFDHYPHWERAPGREPEPGTFSENLSVLGVVETGVAMGDVFRVGRATMQVSRGRRASRWPGKTGRGCW